MDKLDPTLFPWVKDAPSSAPLTPRSPPPQTTSLRSQKPAWHRAPRATTQADNRQRLLVFVAGGMTYSEMREVYQTATSSNKDIFIGDSVSSARNGSRILTLPLNQSGSTHTITPKGFLDDLKVLDLGGAGSAALPNGLRDMRGEAKTFQELYDEKYFVKDPPPPQRAPPPSKNPIPTRVEKFAPIQPSPTNSYQSTSSSLAPSKDEKKKKRGLFRF